MMQSGRLTALPTSERPTAEKGSGFWPTARSTDGAKGGPGQVNGRGQVDSLPGAVNLWPTPQVADARVVTPNGSPFTSLQKELANWPSPDASDWRSGTGWSTDTGHTPQLRHILGGMLNPEWDEQLMGWPTGWTGLPPEVIGRIKKARRRLRGKLRARAARTTLDASKE